MLQRKHNPANVAAQGIEKAQKLKRFVSEMMKARS